MDHVIREIKELESEIRFEPSLERAKRLKAAKYALEWVLDPHRHFDPHIEIK